MPRQEIISIKNGGAVTATTYRKLYEDAENVAANLQNLGYRKGDRLILEISDIHDILVMFWGIALAGMTALPLLPPPDYDFYGKILGSAQDLKMYGKLRIVRRLRRKG